MNRDEEYAALQKSGTPYDGMIRDAADRNQVSYEYLHKKIFNESSFNPNAKSPTGPRGLGQFTENTGKAYGLNSEEDFYNPEKSINAAAAFTKDLVGKYHGDYLKAALAYNQGEGRLGAPQLAALDAGDLSKISEEGRKYMQNLVSVAGDSPSAKLFQGLGVTDPGISPKAPAVSFDSATQGVTAAPKVQRGVLPELGNMGVKGQEPDTARADFAQTEFDHRKAPQGWFEGTGDAIQSELFTSSLGQLMRNVKMDIVDPVDWHKSFDTNTWDDSDFQQMRDAGIDPKMYGFVVDYTRGNRAAIPQGIQLAKENMEAQKRLYGTSTSAQIVAGFAGAGVDPLTYVPIPGASGGKLINRVVKTGLYSGGLAMASEGLREQTTGIEGHYATAMVGGALIGGGLTALIDRIASRAFPLGRTEMSDQALESTLARHGESALPNEYAGPAMRLESRETARQVGAEDPSKMGWHDSDQIMEWNGHSWVDHPSEAGAVRMPDGSVLSGGSPINPKTIAMAAALEPEAERAARGATMGGFTEIGYTLNRSENPAVRDIGNQLFRSTTGTTSGSNGKFGATASDIVERIKGQDHVSYNNIVSAVHEAIDDARYANSKGGRQADMELAYRRVAEALEDSTGRKKADLAPGEVKLMDALKTHYDRKLDLLHNPAQFGNPRATNVLGATRHEGSYIPNVYSDAAKNIHRAKFGSNEGLQTAIIESWMASYASRPHVKARIDKMIAESNKGKVMTPQAIQDAVETYAKNKAYGISHTDEFNRSHLVDDQVTGLVGAENNNFLEGRHLFDSDVSVSLSDGTTFAVNDLRDYDLTRITPSYDRRVNGDIGIMGATGKSTEALKDQIVAMGIGAKNKKEQTALEDAVKLLTGRARRDPDGELATFARAVTDLSFVAKNAYMGIQGLTETAALVTKGHTAMLFKGVPVLRDMMTWGSKIDANQLRDMHGLVFGRELDDLIRPSRQDIIMRLRDHADSGPVASSVLGTFKWATGELSARSPFTKFLVESSNYIADAGRQGFLMELVNHTYGKKGAGQGLATNLFDEKRLHSMSITPDQFKNMQDLIKVATKMGKDGKVTITDRAAFQSNPASMDIWRMGDKLADETILRPHKLSSTDTVAYGAGVKMAMQFKNFTMRSVNARLVRGFYDGTKNSRAIDQTMQAIIATGMATGMYAAMKYAQSSTMPPRDREAFLKQALDPNMLAYAALSRSSHIGAPLGLANMVAAPLGFDQAAMVRSSILPRPKQQKEPGAMKYKPTQSDQFTGFAGRVGDQIPAVGFLGSIGQAGYNAFGLAGSKGRRSDQEYMTGLYNGLRGIIPNDPASQYLLMKVMEDQGIEIRK
jgi:hypothetical protein